MSLPVLIGNNETYGGLMNIEHFSKFNLLPSSTVKFSNFKYLRLFEFSRSVSFTSSVPAFRDHVFHIVSLCSDTKMSRIAAKFVVARMHDNSVTWINSFKLKCKTMCLDIVFLFKNPSHSITVRGNSSSPFKTLSVGFKQIVEVLFSKAFFHVKTPFFNKYNTHIVTYLIEKDNQKNGRH